MRTAHVRVTGRVQGVGFRWHARLEARALRLVGWVRNLDDGSVEARVQGSDAAVAEMLEWLRSGPSGAHVELCEVEHTDAETYPSFEIR